MTTSPRTGRIAWTSRGKSNGSIYYLFKEGAVEDGAIPKTVPADDDKAWYDRVHRGVLAIQQLLTLNGYTTAPTGLFDTETDYRVRAFQAALVPPADGLVGPNTMKALLTPIIASTARAYAVPAKVMFGQAHQESGFDPGAQGFGHWQDSGLWQFNLEPRVTEAKLEAAYDPVKAAHMYAARFKAAMQQYSGKGYDLKINCAIAQHNAPAWADQWFANGQPPNDTIAEYVAHVLAYADEYVAP